MSSSYESSNAAAIQYVTASEIPSFPLMPPSFVTRLCTKDLHECRNELRQILEEPVKEGEEEDLVQYAWTQYGLVAKEIEMRIAKERVQKLFMNNTKAELQLLDERQEQPDNSNEKKEASTGSKITAQEDGHYHPPPTKQTPQKPLKRQDKPKEKVPKPVAKAQKPATSHIKSTSPKGNNNQQEMMKPYVPATAASTPKKKTVAPRPPLKWQQDFGTAFVVKSNTNRRRRRRPAVKKPAAPPTAAEIAQVQEQERSKRRQAAQERLLARRKEQQEKREKDRQRKKQQRQQSSSSEVTTPISPVTQPSDSEPSESDSDISSESDSDTIAEKNAASEVLAVTEPEVPLSSRAEIRDESDVEADENKSLQNSSEESEDTQDVESDTKNSQEQLEQGEVSLSNEGAVLEVEPVEPSTKDSTLPTDDQVVEVLAPETIEDEINAINPEHESAATKSSEVSTDSVAAATSEESLVNTVDIVDITNDNVLAAAAVIEKHLDKDELLDLDARLESIRQQVERATASSIEGDEPPEDHLVEQTPSESLEEVKSTFEATPSPCKDSQVIHEASPVPTKETVSSSKKPKEPKKPAVPKQAVAPKVLKKMLVPKEPTPKTVAPSSSPHNIIDYSDVYSSFYAITSSFYDKGGNKKGYRKVANDEASLRVQLKLYSVWCSIMSDYQSVFSVVKDNPDNDDDSASGSSLLFRVNSSTRPEVYNIVGDAFKKLEGWDELPTGLGLKHTWNMLWSWSKPRVDRSSLLAWQKVNHFPGARALTRKDCLKKNLHRYRTIGAGKKNWVGKDDHHLFDILPETFILPQEYVAFVDSFSKRQATLGEKKNLWIMKPVGLSRGRGISLFNDLGDVCYGESVVVQTYVHNPLLLDGYKFDLRIYVLVTSFNPLEAFIYDEGFVRLCTHRYQDDASSMDNLYAHLTNSSIQKHNTDNCDRDNPIRTGKDTEVGGSKTSLAYLWERLDAQGIDTQFLKDSIDKIVLKSLVCADDQIPFQINSFEVFGYDVLFDQDLRAWLIEVNASPSMAREVSIDSIKDDMILDTIKVVDPVAFDRDALIKVLERRLGKQKSVSSQMTDERQQTNADITAILNGKLPRPYGTLPSEMGQYRRLCPGTSFYNHLLKWKKTHIRGNATSASAIAACFAK